MTSKKCTACKGTGIVPIAVNAIPDPASPHYAPHAVCQECDGTGEIPDTVVHYYLKMDADERVDVDAENAKRVLFAAPRIGPNVTLELVKGYLNAYGLPQSFADELPYQAVLWLMRAVTSSVDIKAGLQAIGDQYGVDFGFSFCIGPFVVEGTDR